MSGGAPISHEPHTTFRRGMTRYFSAAVLFASLWMACGSTVAAGGGAAAGETVDRTALEEAVRGILRNPLSGDRQFVPESALSEETLVRVIPRPEDRQALLNRYEAERAPELFSDPYGRTLYTTCRQFDATEVQGVDLPGEKLAEIIDSSATTVIARVKTVTPGWAPVARTVAEMVVVEVAEVIKQDGEQPLAPGDLVRFVSEGGKITYENVPICDTNRSHQPREGDDILLIGSRSPDHPGLLMSEIFFPL